MRGRSRGVPVVAMMQHAMCASNCYARLKLASTTMNLRQLRQARQITFRRGFLQLCYPTKVCLDENVLRHASLSPEPEFEEAPFNLHWRKIHRETSPRVSGSQWLCQMAVAGATHLSIIITRFASITRACGRGRMTDPCGSQCFPHQPLKSRT